MVKPKIYADFHNADAQGRLRLNCVGTLEDLARQQVALREGLVLTLYADDADDAGQPDELLVDGVVAYSETERTWVAAIDWTAIRHASDSPHAQANGTDAPVSVPPENGDRNRVSGNRVPKPEFGNE
jgi:hypothetical protein